MFYIRVYLLSVSAVLCYVESKSTTKEPAIDYFTEGFIKFFATSLKKKPRELEHLFKPALKIANSMRESGKLNFLGEFGLAWFNIFFQRLHYDNLKYTITYMTELKYFMENRRKQCTEEMNKIIDAANLIIHKSDGEHLFALIKEYEKYPSGNKTGEKLCKELIEAFVNPFVHTKRVNDRKILKYLGQLINDLDEGEQCDTNFKITTVGVNKSNDTFIEGYLIQGYLWFLEIIMKKNEYLVVRVLKNTDVATWKEQYIGQFSWLGMFKKSLPRVISTYLTYTKVKKIRADIKERFYYKMRNRTTAFDKRTNELIDFGNKFITEAQKDELFEVLKDFENFPDSGRDSLDLCEELIKAFTTPFKENEHNLNTEVFVNELRVILKQEYPDEKYAPFFAYNAEEVLEDMLRL